LIGDVALAGADVAGFGNGGHWVSAGIMAGLSATLLLMPTNQAERARPASAASRSKILLKPIVRRQFWPKRTARSPVEFTHFRQCYVPLQDGRSLCR
jgi:hypothetical protein